MMVKMVVTVDVKVKIASHKAAHRQNRQTVITRPVASQEAHLNMMIVLTIAPAVITMTPTNQRTNRIMEKTMSKMMMMKKEKRKTKKMIMMIKRRIERAMRVMTIVQVKVLKKVKSMR